MRTLSKLISTVLAVVLVGSIGLALFGPYTFYIVQTGSMSPTITPGSVVLDTKTQPQPGQVATFQVQGRVFTHRLIQVKSNGTLQTQGDANKSSDPWTVTRADVLGTVAMHVPMVGYALVFIRQPMGILSLVALLTLLYLLRLAWRGLSKPKLSVDSNGTA